MTREEADALKHVAKEELRKRVAALRRALTSEVRAQYSLLACRRLLELECMQRAQVVSAYMPLRFELSTDHALSALFAAGKQVALPRVDPLTNLLSLHAYRPEDELFESAFMVREPRADSPEIVPQDVDVVLVPGLAFDAAGQRLGYGQGFYDRLLGSMRAVRIGLAFDFQMLVEVPSFAHDLPVDYVVTDKRVLRCKE
jgi:5-formyltetrahydrofolate cyclo-ligase